MSIFSNLPLPYLTESKPLWYIKINKNPSDREKSWETSWKNWPENFRKYIFNVISKKKVGVQGSQGEKNCENLEKNLQCRANNKVFASSPLLVLTTSKTPLTPSHPHANKNHMQPRCWAIRTKLASLCHSTIVTVLPVLHAGKLEDICPTAIQLEAVNKWQRHRQTDGQPRLKINQ